MPDGTLYIGNRRYSSWSMRGWLAVRAAGLDVEEVLIPFVRPGPTPAIVARSPNGLVPYLEHRGARVSGIASPSAATARSTRRRCGRRIASRAPMRAPSPRKCTPGFANCARRCG